MRVGWYALNPSTRFGALSLAAPFCGPALREPVGTHHAQWGASCLPTWTGAAYAIRQGALGPVEHPYPILRWARQSYSPNHSRT